MRSRAVHAGEELGQRSRTVDVATYTRCVTSAEVEARLQAGLRRVARLDGRGLDDVRQEAIRRYLARRGISLLDDLQASGAGDSLTDAEAERIAAEELEEMRRERRR